jgi:hypothetical protein
VQDDEQHYRDQPHENRWYQQLLTVHTRASTIRAPRTPDPG